MSVFDLDEQIHTYYSGPRKQHYGFYQSRNQPEAAVARAVALGLIGRDRVSIAVENKIGHLVQFFKGNK